MERTMYYLISLLLLSVTLTVVLASKAQEIQHSGDGRCRFSGRVYNIGDKWQGPNCSEVECSRGSPGTVILTYNTCGAVDIPPKCQVTYDNTKPYPACCQPKFTCQ